MSDDPNIPATAFRIRTEIYRDRICAVERRPDIWGAKDGAGEHAPGAYTFSGEGWETTLLFQRRPMAVAGSNGVTMEALLAVCRDRLAAFQTSEYACDENAEAITHISDAITALESRTRGRVERGVEGTYEK